MTSFEPTTTHLTLYLSSTRAVYDKCGPRSSETATNHRPDHRPSSQRNRPQSHHPNHRPRNPSPVSACVGRSGDCKVSGTYRRKSRPLLQLRFRESRVMGKAYEVRWRRRLLQPSQHPWKHQNSTSNRRWNRSRRRNSNWRRGNANYCNGQKQQISVELIAKLWRRFVALLPFFSSVTVRCGN